MLKPLERILAPVPVPMSDLLGPMEKREGRVKSPERYTTRAAVSAMAVLRAAGVDTVTVAPPAPPVVDPRGLSLAKPTRLKSDAVGCADALSRDVLSAKMGSFIVQIFAGQKWVYALKTMFQGLILRRYT